MSTAEKTDETVMDSPPSDDKEEVPEEAQPEGNSELGVINARLLF